MGRETNCGTCFLFFLDGFNTVSNVLTFVAYEFIANPDVQAKLYAEIKATHDGRQRRRLDYDTLQKMKYLDQVISELLRKWPPFSLIDSICVKEYVYEEVDDLKLNIKKGTTLSIPAYGIHHDAEYFADPEKFDPERFNDENKVHIVPGSYLPFGVAPRNCIGV